MVLAESGPSTRANTQIISIFLPAMTTHTATETITRLAPNDWIVPDLLMASRTIGKILMARMQIGIPGYSVLSGYIASRPKTAMATLTSVAKFSVCQNPRRPDSKHRKCDAAA
jgi:hypothetical protein